MKQLFFIALVFFTNISQAGLLKVVVFKNVSNVSLFLFFGLEESYDGIRTHGLVVNPKEIRKVTVDNVENYVLKKGLLGIGGTLDVEERDGCLKIFKKTDDSTEELFKDIPIQDGIATIEID